MTGRKFSRTQNGAGLKCSITVLFTVAMTLLACTKSNHPITDENETVIFDLPIQNLDVPVGTKSFDLNRHHLVSRLLNHEAVPVGDLMKVIVESHVQQVNALTTNNEIDSVEKIDQKLNELLSPTSDPNLLKIAYETMLERAGALQYTSNATSIENIVRDLFLQCYSGTMLNIVMYKKSLNGKRDSTRTPVVIFEPGHILPGFIVGGIGQERLYGIETTASGRALIDYGFTREVSETVVEPVRVIPMNDYLISEVIKGSLHLSAKERQNLIRFSEQKLAPLGFDGEKAENKIADGVNRGLKLNETQTHALKKTMLTPTELAEGFTPSDHLNATPYGFGQSDEHGEIKQRQKIDTATPVNSTVRFVDVNDLLGPKNGIRSGLPESHARVAPQSPENKNLEVFEVQPSIFSKAKTPILLTIEKTEKAFLIRGTRHGDQFSTAFDPDFDIHSFVRRSDRNDQLITIFKGLLRLGSYGFDKASVDESGVVGFDFSSDEGILSIHGLNEEHNLHDETLDLQASSIDYAFQISNVKHAESIFYSVLNGKLILSNESESEKSAIWVKINRIDQMIDLTVNSDHAERRQEIQIASNDEIEKFLKLFDMYDQLKIRFEYNEIAFTFEQAKDERSKNTIKVVRLRLVEKTLSEHSVELIQKFELKDYEKRQILEAN